MNNDTILILIFIFKQVTKLYKEGDRNVNEQLFQLSRGLDKQVLSYKCYMINGFKFHTNDHEGCLKTQNSGVVVRGDTGIVNLDYYGVLSDVVELQYMGGNRVVLFKCNWWDVHSPSRGIDIDKYGIISVNAMRHLRTDEPFVLAYQAEQVFYVNDNLKSDWQVILKIKPRDFYNMPSNKEDQNHDESEAIQQNLNDSARTFAHVLTNNFDGE